MIYNNLIYLLIVILLFTTTSVPESPGLPFLQAVAAWLLKAYLFYRGARTATSRIKNSKDYFSFEHRFSILAIISFSIDIYFLDCKYYLAQLPLTGHLPVTIDGAGLALFFLYLSIMWEAARPGYQRIFGRGYTRRSFLLSNLRNNLPIVLPWLLLSLLVDLLQLVELPFLETLPASRWGGELLFLLFFLLLALTFPALIKRLWGCTSLPAGPERRHIEDLCARQKFTYSDIMLWPLFEGQAVTAGVMGIYKRLRYLLVTPALLNSLTPDEIEAVMAHEIGHAKKYHLQLYLFIFLGFALLVSLVSNPVLYLVLNTDLFYRLMSLTDHSPDTGLAFWGTVPLFGLMIVYFRYVFGFFMRNFERQADLYVFKAIGHSDSLISALEKVGWLSGNIRDLPSWHHFGISERVDFLNRCSRDPGLIKKQDFKVFGSLLLYILLLAGGAGLLQTMPMDHLANSSKNKFVEAVIKYKTEREPKNPVWHRLLGDIMQEKKMAPEALQSYEKGLALAPADPEILNNLAWLLLTCEEKTIRDPERALKLARTAATSRPEGFILDTLATAWWANNNLDLAQAAAREAMARDPQNRTYYRRQIDRFQNNRYNDNSPLFKEEKFDR